jgi:hypothetical protein
MTSTWAERANIDVDQRSVSPVALRAFQSIDEVAA